MTTHERFFVHAASLVAGLVALALGYIYVASVAQHLHTALMQIR